MKVFFQSLLVLLFLVESAGAQGPKVQDFKEVEKGFEIGLMGGAGLDFKPPEKISAGLGALVGLELGYDITSFLRLKAGFLTNYYEATVKDSRGKDLSMDFRALMPWGGISFCLVTTQRTYLYIQGSVGYAMTSPKKLGATTVSGNDDVALSGGAGVEYYPNLRHISFALEANFSYFPMNSDFAVGLLGVVRYTFGVAKFKTIKPTQDRDGDGVPDKDDQCPDTWGPESNRGCPEADTDGDGVIDKEDRCPNEPGPASNSGCPIDPDTDGDGIPDKRDKCPREKGPASTDGCPDRDEDGIPDHVDKCPDEPGKPENDGCPSQAQIKVKVSQRAIELREKINFEFGKARILPSSFPLLDQVVSAMRDHPEIRKLRVEGHTDNKGSAAYNLKLSQSRAESVVNYLVEKGIESDRLVPKGFGLAKPIAPNTTEKGRAANRRVEMIILERAE